MTVKQIFGNYLFVAPLAVSRPKDVIYQSSFLGAEGSKRPFAWLEDGYNGIVFRSLR